MRPINCSLRTPSGLNRIGRLFPIRPVVQPNNGVDPWMTFVLVEVDTVGIEERLREAYSSNGLNGFYREVYSCCIEMKEHR